MELTAISISSKIEQTYKTESTKEARKSRCRIISEKTGREIMCPYNGQHSCFGCAKAADMNHHTSVPLSLDTLFTDESGEGRKTFDIPAPDNTEQKYVQKDIREHIRYELTELDMLSQAKNRRAMNLQVFDLWLQDYSFTEISKTLGISKATLHDDLVRIAEIVKKHID